MNNRSSKLYELLSPWVSDHDLDFKITDLKLDSREIKWGNLFIAVSGYTVDGRLYIENAIKSGAIAVLSDSNQDGISVQYIVDFNFNVVPIVYFNNLKKHISNIAGRFYGDPSRFLNLVGVTGTNGKTTITHLLSNWVQLIGERSAVMGTLGNGMLNNMCPSFYTTCSAIDVQKMLVQFVNEKIKFVAMEVSSHGLVQYRVDALHFDVAIFSNLSHDHLDYHGDFKHYLIAKQRLFSTLNVKKYVINSDDDIGYQWLYYLNNAVAVTMTNKLPSFWSGKWICLMNANYYIDGTDIIFNSSWGSGVIHSNLLGIFNVSNMLLALGALLIMGYPLSLLLSKASQLKPVCGRLEVFQSHNKPTVIVDYAHTPDALEKVLGFMKQLCRRKLWCIFGCGGNRDQSKRALMGRIAEYYSDYIIITNDNPRTEKPRSIINDIIYGIEFSKKIFIIENRADAVNTAISLAHVEDLVLISGKGHETSQIIGDTCIKYSDQNIIKQIFSECIS